MTIALFGGSFNPPGLHHRAIAAALRGHFDRVVVVPCGPRRDKRVNVEVPASLRSRLVELTFGDLSGVEIDTTDLQLDIFTRSFDLFEKYEAEGETWLVIGTDLVRGGARGESPIQGQWYRGHELWTQARFAILTRPEVPCEAADLPPRSRLIELDYPGSSSEIRTRLRRGLPIAELVTEGVERLVLETGAYSRHVDGDPESIEI